MTQWDGGGYRDGGEDGELDLEERREGWRSTVSLPASLAGAANLSKQGKLAIAGG